MSSFLIETTRIIERWNLDS